LKRKGPLLYSWDGKNKKFLALSLGIEKTIKK